MTNYYADRGFGAGPGANGKMRKAVRDCLRERCVASCATNADPCLACRTTCHDSPTGGDGAGGDGGDGGVVLRCGFRRSNDSELRRGLFLLSAEATPRLSSRTRHSVTWRCGAVGEDGSGTIP